MNEINLYNIDCMEFMKDIPDKYYDLANVDPPYGKDFANKVNNITRGVKHDKKNWDKKPPPKNIFQN